MNDPDFVPEKPLHDLCFEWADAVIRAHLLPRKGLHPQSELRKYLEEEGFQFQELPDAMGLRTHFYQAVFPKSTDWRYVQLKHTSPGELLLMKGTSFAAAKIFIQVHASNMVTAASILLLKANI